METIGNERGGSAEAPHRATAFGTKAQAYAENRPSYPVEAVRWALDPVTDSGSPDLRGLAVLDLAAGTGKLTEVLVAQGAEVLAVEPDPAMLAELSRRLPRVQTLSGRAERIPVPDQSVDAVVAGQAFHWFDMDQAMAEIARVLKPGGVVGALWNLEDVRVPWVAGLAEVSELPRDLETWQEDQSTLAGHEPFDSVERAEFASPQQLTSEAFVARTATRSSLIVMAEDERAQVLARIRGYLRACPETANGSFVLPTVTGVDRAVRGQGD
ncbi:methyltransferase domain-containing protein [Actinopolymorpha sp. B17G11]|uniref:class I SAM-dependent methyltransferase n=1 Tax=Actinopolymorpha sp. B17G11 TaxID=3160861 RepID=UPI0032E4F8C0